MNAQQARRRREAALARQVARCRQRRRRLGIAAMLAVVLVAGTGALAFSVAGRHRQAVASPAALAGLRTGPPPWGANTTDLAERLQAIGVPPLSAMEGEAVHIHQHLDLYVDGRAYQGDPTTLALAAHQELVVAFGTAAELPSPVPPSYRFAPGL